MQDNKNFNQTTFKFKIGKKTIKIFIYQYPKLLIETQETTIKVQKEHIQSLKEQIEELKNP